jgi:flagellar biosynthesis protein
MVMTKKDEKVRLAAALKYDPQKEAAPVVTAKGRGTIAEKIIDIAKKNRIPIKEDPGLIQILSKLEVDEQIPPVLYKAVAEILAFVYSLNEKKRGKIFPSIKNLPTRLDPF